jgi:hypothetical protein
MHNMRRWLSITIALMTFAPGAALAKNYCISGFPNTSYVLVGKAFTVPPKGACKAFLGFNPVISTNFPVTGVACTSSDGKNVSFTLTSSDEVTGLVEIDSISLALPSATGSVVGQDLQANAVTSYTASGITGAACTTNTIPEAAAETSASAPTGSGVWPAH